jgi:hypothetical protein
MMEDDYTTRDPVLFTVCAVLIFAFSSAVFFVYDSLVEKRQKKVMTTAVQSSAIVSSLFPSAVRERMFQPDDTGESTNPTNDPTSMSSRPIADRYPSATVMFADM